MVRLQVCMCIIHTRVALGLIRVRVVRVGLRKPTSPPSCLQCKRGPAAGIAFSTQWLRHSACGSPCYPSFLQRPSFHLARAVQQGVKHPDGGMKQPGTCL